MLNVLSFLMFSVFLLAWILPPKNYCICALLILKLPYRHNFTREEGSWRLSINVFWSEYKKDIFKAQFDPIWKKKSPRHCNTHKETRLLFGEYPEHFRKRGSMYSPGMDDVSSKERNVLHVDVIELTLGNRSLCKQKLYQDDVCL